MMLAAAAQICVVKYVGQTQCNASDSGFDATNATPDPPWISVAKGQTTRVAKAEITPAGNAGSVGFVSGESRIATVQPATATKSPQPLAVKGIAPGETLIGAVVNQTLGESLNVVVYEKKIIKVVAHLVQIRGSQGLCPKPQTTLSGLRAALNKIWDQAAVEFTLQTDTFFGQKAIDLSFVGNGDCMLNIFMGQDRIEEDKVILDVKNQTTLEGDVHIFFMQQLEKFFGYYIETTDNIFAEGLEDQLVDPRLAQIPLISTHFLIGHELGHFMNLPHCEKSNKIFSWLSGWDSHCLFVVFLVKR
jgi:hypothetical protein